MSNGKVIHLKKKECNIFFTKNIYKVYQKKLKKKREIMRFSQVRNLQYL